MDSLDQLRELSEKLWADSDPLQKELKQLKALCARCAKHQCKVLQEMIEAGEMSTDLVHRSIKESTPEAPEDN